MVNRLRFALLWALCPCSIFAQSKVLKDPDIVWAAALEQDWVLDVPSLADEWQEGISTLKLLCEDPEKVFSTPPTLSSLVSYAAASGQIPIFSDPGCTISTDWRTVLGYSDQIIFDPDFNEEIVVKTCTYFDPEAFKSWRLRQVLAFHQKSHSWSTTVESIAPLARIVNEVGDSVDTRPIFWFKPFNNPRNLHSKQVVWAKKTVNKPAKTQVPIAVIEPIKQRGDFPGLLPTFEAIVLHHPEIPLYHGTEDRLFTPEERSTLILRTDTLIHCFAPPEPDSGAVEVIFLNLLTQVQALRLVQTWYWDEKRHQLAICLDAIAPLRNVLDNEGNLRYVTPLYYQKAKR